MRRGVLLLSLVFAQSMVVRECGSNGAPTELQNVQPVVVNSGPANEYINGLFTTITLCVPGQSSNCQTIGGVLVDTGSSGVRILSSALTLSLPQQTNGAGPVGNCGEFADGYTWGPMVSADIQLAGEQANSVPIQVIGAPGFPGVPNNCASTGPAENTLETLGANGVLGIGLFRQDCGPACLGGGDSNPGLYYACPSACVPTVEPLALQLQNPVWMFPADNNGTVIQLPAVPASGAASTNGSLIFGIGTQSNNALGSAKVSMTDLAGNFTTSFSGTSYGSSYVDSGTNGYFFLDSATTGLPVCPDTADFYCPPTTAAFNAVTIGANGTQTPVAFTIANGDQQLNTLAFTAFSALGGPNAGGFAWGLPFFFGRTVFTAIEGQATSGGPGPYWAY